MDKDNAGCYHCRASIVGARIIARQQGAAIRLLDFTDTQGAKGACEHKVATVKVHMWVAKMSHAILGGQFAFVKHCLESGTLFVSCT